MHYPEGELCMEQGISLQVPVYVSFTLQRISHDIKRKNYLIRS